MLLPNLPYVNTVAVILSFLAAWFSFGWTELFFCYFLSCMLCYVTNGQWKIVFLLHNFAVAVVGDDSGIFMIRSKGHHFISAFLFIFFYLPFLFQVFPSWSFGSF